MQKTEFEIVNEFTNKLGLKNKTDGTLFIYKKPNKAHSLSLKPDGYYYLDGVTFILDAKAEGKSFEGQLEDYMKLEKNPNFIGFKYNGKSFECYIQGKLAKDETTIRTAKEYISKYFPNAKITLPEKINTFAKKLANDFRNARVSRQNNVPFIGAVMLCLKYCENFEDEINSNNSKDILNNIKNAINKYIEDTPQNKKLKKEQIKLILNEQSLNQIEYTHLISLISDISSIYNFINVEDRIGHDTMNGFLKVFRKWNSANAKEKGEVFTPDHIAELMYKLADCSHESKILDPTCGSGTFLVISMFNMLKEIDNLNLNNESKINLKKIVLQDGLYGIESDMFNATLSDINMMLHGDGSSHIFKDNCFDKLPELKGIYNRALMNPPFSQKDNELKFVWETLQNMEYGGIVSAIVPISCILSAKETKKTVPENLKYKRLILEHHNLLQVIRLPKKLFHPNASVQTAIITIQAHTKYSQATKRKNFLDDGYIESRNVGRTEHHIDLAQKQFNEEKWEIVNLKAEDDWPKYDAIDYSTITKLDFVRQKLDFVRQKLDFVLLTQDINNLIIENNGIIDLSTINVSDTKLDFNKWKEFRIVDLFDIENGKDKSDENNPDNKEGKIPLVIASKNHNGIGYYIKKAKKIFNKNCITLVNQGDGASGIAKAHNYDFAATSSVSVLSNKNLNPSINLFISTVMSKLHDLFDYTYSMSNERLSKIKILLPAKLNENKKWEPDWEFMEKYIENKI
ncbi:N-6 DNA methylase [Mycoplasma bradburyae]|uniref:N-6 DNA methylase n=1 Tax=Mycoplasma bradburyae TaxID=2963128 RepID=UPI0023426980|nr:N-6 DNA methylase [Mycoplasma bradburyae]MDC4182555.1 N-6 DNA methylase [Mycoplasma bradburyae]